MSDQRRLRALWHSVRMVDDSGRSPEVSIEERVVRGPDLEAVPPWVRDANPAAAITDAGLTEGEEVWVVPEMLRLEHEAFVGGVRVRVSLHNAFERDAKTDPAMQVAAEMDRVHTHAFQVERQVAAISPEDGSALVAPFLFHFRYAPVAFNADAPGALAHDDALMAVTSHAHDWLNQLWRWAIVVGARRLAPFGLNLIRYLATVAIPDGQQFQVMPHRHRTVIAESSLLLARRQEPLTSELFEEIVALTSRGVPAPAAPLLVVTSVETAMADDLRTALILAGTALDLILDQMWSEERVRRPSLPELSGTLGRKAQMFDQHQVALPGGLSRPEFQSKVVNPRNGAAHGDPLDQDEAWSALSEVVDMARDLWPEGLPSQWVQARQLNIPPRPW